MKPSPRDSVATKTLLQLIRDRATGRLEVGAGSAAIQVYLLHGDVVAAVSPEDDRQLVHLLSLRGVIDAKQRAALDARIEEGEAVFVDLLGLGAKHLDELLSGRFRQNLCDYVASLERPRFTPQKAVFVDNIQMGHESKALVEACCAMATKANRISVDVLLVRAKGRPRKGIAALIANLLGSEPQTVSSLLYRIPIEPTSARGLLFDLVGEGVASVPGHDEPVEDVQPEPTPEPEPEPEPEPAPEPEPQPEPEPDEDDTLDSDAPGTAVAGEGVPSSLAAWLSDATHVDDDELDFFSDHDYDRGGDEDGAFSTQSHNLDKVEVADLGDDDELLEADEAPAAKFSAPVLSEDDAEAKLIVMNEVLGQIVAAFDEAEGNGRGQAVVQLLVDGGPSKFAPLLHEIRVSPEGHLDPDHVINNLYRRPATEHRQLLNNGVLDIIERALSSAADDLPEEAFDSVYEAVAGYRQRLGL